MKGKKLSFPFVYFPESGLFNGLRPIKIKKSPARFRSVRFPCAAPRATSLSVGHSGFPRGKVYQGTVGKPRICRLQAKRCSERLRFVNGLKSRLAKVAVRRNDGCGSDFRNASSRVSHCQIDAVFRASARADVFKEQDGGSVFVPHATSVPPAKRQVKPTRTAQIDVKRSYRTAPVAQTFAGD